MERMSNNLETDELLVKYLLGSASSEEREAVKAWLAADVANKRHFDQLRDIYFLGKITKEESGFDRQKCLDEVKIKYYREKTSGLESDKTIQQQKIRNLRIAVSIAASVIVIIGIASLLNLLKPESSNLTSSPVAYNEIVTPKGARTNITLPDGTNVWLNADSRLRYEMDFIRNERVVYLTGEAFFDVAKSKGKLFIVNTGKIAVKAWGTKFNVKAYPEENTIKTTLVEGSVSIKKLEGAVSADEEYLKPNETAIFYKAPIQEVEDSKVQDNKVNNVAVASLNLEKIEVKTELFTSWKDSKWIIEKLTLDQLVPELERRYNVEITLEDSAIRFYKVSGSLQNETFDQVMRIIKLSAPIDYEINANRIVLRENKTSKNIYEKFLKR